MDLDAPCYLHPRRPATAACAICRQRICDRCDHGGSGRVVCVACAPEARLRRRIGRIVGGVAALVLVGGLVVTLTEWATRAAGPGRGPVAGQTSPEVPQRPAGGVPAESPHIDDVAASARESETRPAEAALRARLAREVAAADRARAEAEAARAELRAERAAADRAAAQAREAWANAEAERANAQAEREEAQAEREEAEVERAAATLARRALDDCAVELAESPAGFLVELRVNGAWVELIVDTGASISVLTEEAADRVGLDIDPRRIWQVHTPSGQGEMRVGVADWIGLDALAVDTWDLGVCSDCERMRDGLFGRDLQTAFDVDLDLLGKRLLLPGCE